MAQIGNTIDFETGDFSQVDGTGNQGSGSAVVSTSANYQAVYGTRLTVATGGAFDYAEVFDSYSYPASNILHVTLAFRVVTTGGEHNILFFSWYDLSEPVFRVAQLRRLGGVDQFLAYPRDGSAAVVTNLPTFASNQWYLLQWGYSAAGANPVAFLRINGVEVARYTDTTTGTVRQPDYISLFCYDLFNATGTVDFDYIRYWDADPFPPGALTPMRGIVGP